MSPTEYYLNLLGGFSGASDDQHLGGRVLTAAILSHFRLTASNKSEINSLLGIRQSPGFMLAQKEDSKVGEWRLNSRPGMAILKKIVTYEKVGRSMNYCLNWDSLEGMVWSKGSPEFYYLAMIYWVGFYLFGRNVIPEAVLQKIRENTREEEGIYQEFNQNSPYVKKFFQETGICDLEGEVDMASVNLSLVCAISPAYNYLGAIAQLSVWEPNQEKNLREAIQEYDPTSSYRPGNFTSPINSIGTYHLFNHNLQLYCPNGEMAPVDSQRWPTYLWTTLSLFFVELNTSQLWMRNNGSYYPKAIPFQPELRNLSKRIFISAAILWEFHLFIKGTPLYELGPVLFDREELLEEAKIHFMPERNYTLYRLFEVHLERIPLV